MSMQSPHPSADDPWDWSVDQVVRGFCLADGDRPTWCSPTDPLPEPAALERELRDNDVTGEIILTDVTREVLRTELNIKSMGQRHTIEKGINHLRSISPKYQTWQSQQALAPPITPVQSWLNNSVQPYLASNVGGSVQSGVPTVQRFDSPRLDAHPDPLRVLHRHNPNLRDSLQILPPRPSSVEVQRIGSPLKAQIDSPQNATIPQIPVHSTNQSELVEKPPKARRRIAPTFVSHLDDKTRHSAPLFGEDNSAADRDDSVEQGNGGREFSILGVQGADGQRIGASRRIKKYLTSVDKELPADREPLPVLTRAGSRDNSKITEGLEGHPERNDYDLFDYLLAKYPTGPDTENALAVYGDSGDEGEYDEETWQEIQQELAEDRNNGHSDRALSLSEVNPAIDAVIQELKSVWQESRLPKVQAKGFRLWKKANRDGTVGDEIATAQYWIQRLQQSVINIRQAICRETWSTVAAVRHQCQSLEETVFQLQEHQYNISILRRATAPARPDRKSIQHQKSKPLDLGEGEVILESESELSLSNFIEDDEAEPLSSTRRPATSEEVACISPSDDSDNVLSPRARRRHNKLKFAPVDPRSIPFIESSSSSPKLESSRTDSDLDLPAPLPKSQYEELGHNQTQPIELFSSSDPPTPARVNTTQETEAILDKDVNGQPSTPIRQKVTLKPLLLDVEGIKKLSWDKIEKDNDYRRALAKAYYMLSPEKANQIRDFVNNSPDASLQQVLHQGLSAMINRQTHLAGIAQHHGNAARMTALLFASYALARNIMDKPQLDKARMKKAQDLIASGFSRFVDTLSKILTVSSQGHSVKGGKRKLSDAESREDGYTSDSDSAVQQRTPGKRRRRYVQQSQTAISSQLAGQQRVQEMQQRMASIEHNFAKIPRNQMDAASYAIGVEDPVICLDPKIGEKVKPHQINGIRFMWRELMTDENKQGCLLAHTMGLGKTMQVISLLVTIAQSTKSPEAAIRKQIPRDLQDLKVLVLCPPSLIENWFEEILMWRPTPTVLGEIYKITQKLRRPDRVREIAQWAHTGGILIISYEMFRGLIINKAPGGKGADERPINDADHAAIEENLLNEPNIIIADEAHKMKNPEAGISMVTSRFRSSRRIALTGSPLANNLDEYFAMIDWIAPGYLGTKVQFSAKYAIPISAGLYNDSDMHDRRTSLRRLHVLKKNLDPKISRADITAIANDLPSKTEFFITIPLTKLQTKAYNLYIRALLGGDDLERSGNGRLWDWLAILSLLCHHPSTFLNKLDDRQYGHASKKKRTKPESFPTTDDVDDIEFLVDVELANSGLSPELIEEERKIFRAAEDAGTLEEPNLSHRSQIVCEIIQFAVTAGDKVLLFSHNIPTLDYLESTISSLGFSTCRLDGSTNVTKRQEAVKDFNKETAQYNVFFISTRAGGLGLNLQGANRVILFDYGFNPTWEEQAIGRAYRLGQQKPVFVYRLRAGGTFEELIYNKAVFKTQLSARVVDKKNPMRYASKKATDYLFPVKEVPQRDLEEFRGKDPLVLDAVLHKSNLIRDIILTETFQKEENESLTAEEEKQANDELKDEQEMRRDPDGWKRKLQNTSVNIRAPATPQNLVRHSAYPRNFAFRSSGLENRTTQPSVASPVTTNQPSIASATTATTTPTQPVSYISNPNAIRSPQQAEGAPWDQRPPHLLQSRVQNVIGIPPDRNIIRTSYPSPTSEARPTEVRKAPEQADGTRNDKSGSHAELDECKTQ